MQRTLVAGVTFVFWLIGGQQPPPVAPAPPPTITTPAGSAAVEQSTPGTRPPAVLVESFDGLGVGFKGPQGTTNVRNPSDNTLAVGPDHIVQIVNSQTAIFTKKGEKFETTGRVLYGPVNTANFFRGFGGQCEATNNGDAVVRYDQIAKRWLVVMPLFRRGPVRPDQPDVWKPSANAYVSPPGMPGQPGKDMTLFQPPPPSPPDPSGSGQRGQGPPAGRGQGRAGPYSMCYAISSGEDPMGSYFRYEFLRPLFPDYPRPAIWRDGYYVPTSTGDEVIEKHACVVERAKMLKGEPAREQCVVLDGVGFLNNADIDGTAMPPAGAPNIMMTAGGSQLKNVLEDDGVYAWRFAVDWHDAAKTKVTGPDKIAVAPYRYLCDGQLKNCVPQTRHRPPARFAGRQNHVAASVSADWQSRIDRRRAFGKHDCRWRRRALVRVSARSKEERRAPPAGHVCAGRVVSLDGQSGDRSAWQYRDWLFLRRTGTVCRSAARRPHGERPSWCVDLARGSDWSRGRTPRRACVGRTTRRLRLTRLMIARFGTSATTSRKAHRATRAGSARSGCRAVGSLLTRSVRLQPDPTSSPGAAP